MRLSEVKRLIQSFKYYYENEEPPRGDFVGYAAAMAETRMSIREERLRLFLEEQSGHSVGKCDRCETLFPLEHHVMSGDAMYCPHCKQEYLSLCDGCEDYCRSDDMMHPEGLSYCEECYHDRYIACHSCGDDVHHDYAYGRGDYSYCADCDPGDDEDEGDYDEPTNRVAGHHTVQEYSADVTKRCVRPWLHLPSEATDKLGNSRSLLPTRWLGFELEVTTKCNRGDSHTYDECVQAIGTALDGRGILKSDGSISGYGFEIVSLPGTIAYHQTQWGEDFFRTLVEHCRGWTETSCGMHVHMSRASLTHLQLGRMVAFVTSEGNRQFIEKVAGRGAVRYSQIYHKKVTSIRRTKWNGVSGAEGTRYRTDEHDVGRYQAINLERPKTIEFRIFQSNCSMVGFLKNLEFCDAVANFAATASNNMLDSAHFLKFMSDHRGVYPNFAKWAVRERLMDTKHTAKPGSTEIILSA